PVRVRGVRLRQRHRHVQVHHSGVEAGLEDRYVEPRIDRVQHRVGTCIADERRHGVLARGVDSMSAEAAVVEAGDDSVRPSGVVVRERTVLEEGAPRRDLREGGAYATCSDNEQPHGAGVLHERPQLWRHLDRSYAQARVPDRRSDVSVAVTQHKQFVGGEFVDSTSGETMEVLNPATGEVIAEVPRGTAEDVGRAVDAAKKAWDEWQGKTPKDRMELLLELADVIDENAEELARLESLNVGKPWWVAVDEPGVMSDNLRFFAGAARNLEGK